MAVAIVTGAGGLVGSETAVYLMEQGLDVIGIDNDRRAYFFGPEASTKWRVAELRNGYRQFTHMPLDICDADGILRLFKQHAQDLKLVVHAAAQPSHDWAAREPLTDFAVNAQGTLNLLEAVRQTATEVPFIFLSTNKVYGDRPNALPLIEQDSRWELDPAHAYAAKGIDESMSIDQSTHSVFGASKVAADVMVQEYGRYFGMNTACFRGGCLTGGAHSGAELHGFLAYLMKCTVIGRPYTVFGYKAKQVRDNIHSHDLVNALWTYAQDPKPARVYNIGGSRFANCSMREAIATCEDVSGQRLNWTYSDENRTGDHIWWVSDISTFQADFPDYQLTYNIRDTLEDIYEAGLGRWKEAS
ncbi:MAG: NAD-dependent epimerase/dehydratase family protein [Paracoccaceae bacterium]